jgi:hypothetical protein
VPEDIVLTLEENGYSVDMAGPEGFGKFHEHRRLVAMYRKDNPQNGHVILIYEFDKGVFDAAGAFKQVGDILWSGPPGIQPGSRVADSETIDSRPAMSMLSGIRICPSLKKQEAPIYRMVE